MSGFLTQEKYAQVIDLPIAVPATELRRGDSIICASVDLKLGQRIRYRWAQLQLITILNAGTPDKIISNLGMVYLGFYSAGFTQLNKPTGIPINALSADLVGVNASNPYIFFDFSSPDTYSVLLVNNTTNLDFEVTANGAMRLSMLD